MWVRKSQLQIIAAEINIAVSWMYVHEKNYQAMSEANVAFFKASTINFTRCFKIGIFYTSILHIAMQYFSRLIVDSCHLYRR